MTSRQMRLGAAATFSGILCALPGVSVAQLAPTTQRVTDLSFNYTLRADSNVARTNATQAAARGLDRADQRVTPSLDLVISRPLGRNAFEIKASAGYDFYRRNPRLNRERIEFAGTGTLVGGPCTLLPNVSFSRRQSDLADIGFVGVPGIGSVRNVQTVQHYGSELSCGQAYGLRPLVSLDREIGDNSDPRRRIISDYRSTRYGAGVGFNSYALGNLSVRVTRDDTDYPNRPSLFGSGTGFRTDRLVGTLQRNIGGMLTANGSVFYISLKPQGTGSGSVRDFKSIGYNLGLTLIPNPSWKFTGSFGRDTLPSLGADALYSVSENYSLEAVYALSERINLGLTGLLSTRDYVGAGTALGPLLTNSKQRSLFGTINYNFSRRLGFSLETGYQNRNANGSVYDFDNYYAAFRTRLTW